MRSSSAGRSCGTQALVRHHPQLHHNACCCYESDRDFVLCKCQSTLW